MDLKKKEIKIFGFSFLVGLVAHFFIIANPLFNADGIFYNRSMGGGSIFGRWLIEIFNILAKNIGYSTVIPMLNVVLALLIISFSSIYLLRLLNIKDAISNYIIACSLVLSPALVQTFFYGFTAHVYALAIFFTILSIYELIVKDRAVFSIFLNVLALALYQAYIPFMLCIYVVVFMKLIKDNDLSKCFIILLKTIICFALAFVMYMMLNDIINSRNHNYIFAVHGMSEYVVPKFTFESLILALKTCYIAIYDIVFKHNVFAHNTTLFIRIIYLVLIIVTMLSFIHFITSYMFRGSLYKEERIKIVIKGIFLILLFITFPIALNFMFIMTNNGIGYIEDRISLSYTFYIILPLVIVDMIEDIKGLVAHKLSCLKYLTRTLTICVLVHNIWLAYGSYYNQFKIINASKSFALELATTIKMLPGYNNETSVLFIESPYLKNSHFNYGYYVDAEHNMYSNFDVEYENIMAEYPMKQIFKEFTALEFEEPEKDFATNLYYSKAVREMPIYPADGSVKLVENVAVVKFQEPTY